MGVGNRSKWHRIIIDEALIKYHRIYNVHASSMFRRVQCSREYSVHASTGGALVVISWLVSISSFQIRISRRRQRDEYMMATFGVTRSIQVEHITLVLQTCSIIEQYQIGITTSTVSNLAGRGTFRN